MYFIDFNDMVDNLQAKYKEYGRRKRSDFMALVEKGMLVTLLLHCLAHLEECTLISFSYSSLFSCVGVL